MSIDRHLQHSDRVVYEDLDWNEARRAGLTEDEVFILTYFSDIESQTIMYMRDILNTKGVLDPDVMSFLTIWNYEEFYHGQALAKLLSECGHPLTCNRIEQVRKTARFTETLKRLGAMLFSQFLPDDFIALYMSWGALNEITTLRGYETIEQRTQNPVLRELCQRIAKQERRHFAWYYNGAQERLQKCPRARAVTRWILERVWSPVGAGVKKEADVIHVYNLLFPGKAGETTGNEIDEKIRALPGLSDVALMSKFAKKAARPEPGFTLDASPSL